MCIDETCNANLHSFYNDNNNNNNKVLNFMVCYFLMFLTCCVCVCVQEIKKRKTHPLLLSYSVHMFTNVDTHLHAGSFMHSANLITLHNIREIQVKSFNLMFICPQKGWKSLIHVTVCSMVVAANLTIS